MFDCPKGRVFFASAGRRGLALLTVRGAELLGAADSVVYDDSINKSVLKLAHASTEFVPIAVTHGSSSTVDNSETYRVLVDLANRGKKVVRLVCDDVACGALNAEEIAALKAAQVSYEIIPGASPMLSDLALVETTLIAGNGPLILTDNDATEAFGTGADIATLTDVMRRGGFLLARLDAAAVGKAIKALTANGLDGSVSVAAIRSAGNASQQTTFATLSTLASDMHSRGTTGEVIVLVGPVGVQPKEGRRRDLMPLNGRRIVVTRSREAAAMFSKALQDLGAEITEFPTIAIVAPDSYQSLDRAIRRLRSFDWIIFTSANGVETFVARLRTLGHDIREMAGASIAAIGPATAARLKHHALRVTALPEEYRAEAIAETIGNEGIREARFLIPRAQVAREALPKILVKAGAAEVQVAAAYKTIKPTAAEVNHIRAMLQHRTIDLVAFTSPSTVINFCELVGPLSTPLQAAAIGPITAQAARDFGIEVIVVPPIYTVPALTNAIADFFAAASK